MENAWFVVDNQIQRETKPCQRINKLWQCSERNTNNRGLPCGVAPSEPVVNAAGRPAHGCALKRRFFAFRFVHIVRLEIGRPRLYGLNSTCRDPIRRRFTWGRRGKSNATSFTCNKLFSRSCIEIKHSIPCALEPNRPFSDTTQKIHSGHGCAVWLANWSRSYQASVLTSSTTGSASAFTMISTRP